MSATTRRLRRKRKRETALIICTPIGEAPILPAGRYQTASCSECGASVWISNVALETARGARLDVVAMCQAHVGP